MLMIKGTEIQLTEVSPQGDPSHRLKGASYKDRLFLPQGKFAKEQKSEALEHCRKLFSDPVKS